MILLGFDTATPATAVAITRGGDLAWEGRHDPPAGERPGHATRLLPLVHEGLEAAGLAPRELDRIAVGTGPGSFTGLRIGVATARALSQGTGAELVGVCTLRALAEGAGGEGVVVAVLDARRGEAFAAAWLGAERLLAPDALAPESLAEAVSALPAPVLAVGDGAIRFRPYLEPAGAAIPPDSDPLHRVGGRHVCRLGAGARPAERDEVLPEYVRLPDAEEARRRRATP